MLPAFLARLLGLAPLDVFAVCFPLLFALVLVAVFQIARRVLPTAQALVAGVLFVAFLEISADDMTMLNRQQVGTLFFAVIVTTLLDERPSRRRSWLLVVLTVGLTVVSHYTTTYVAAALLLLAWTLPTAPALLRRRPLRLPGPGRRGRRAAGRAGRRSGRCSTGTDEVLTTTIREAALVVGSKANVKSEATVDQPGRRQPAADRPGGRATYLDGLRTNAERQTRTSPGRPYRLPNSAGLQACPDTRAGAVLTGVGVDPGRYLLLPHRCGGPLPGRGGRRRRAVAACRGGTAGGGKEAGPAGPPSALATASLLLLAGTVVAPQLSDDYGPLRRFFQ